MTLEPKKRKTERKKRERIKRERIKRERGKERKVLSSNKIDILSISTNVNDVHVNVVVYW